MSDSKKYWKGLEELKQSPEFERVKHGEFADELPLPVLMGNGEQGLPSSRRDFLKLLGFSMAGTALASCTRMPVQKAIPYLTKPEEVTPGVSNWYASTCQGCSASCSLLVKVRDGRPIKVEGNPQFPLTKGGLCAVGQASVLSLYDDERLKKPLLKGQPSSWNDVDAFVKQGLESGGSGKIVILSGTLTSPTTKAVLKDWMGVFPGSEHVTYEAVSQAAIPTACERSFGLKVLPHYRFDRAREIVSFQADFLGAWLSPVEFTKAYAASRVPGPDMSHHVQFESRMTLTGSNADVRIPISRSEEGAVLQSLLRLIAEKSGQTVSAAAASHRVDAKVISEVAGRLWAARGASLVLCGTNDVGLQMTVNAINSLLGNIGKTVDLDNPSFQKQGDDAAMAALVDSMNQGQVRALILLGVNPVYDFGNAPVLESGLGKVPLVVAISERLDETSSRAHVVAPAHHFLESWGDSEAVSGSLTFLQPTIRPLFETRQMEESLFRWMGKNDDYYTYLRRSWEGSYYPKSSGFATFDAFWDKSVQDGFFVLEGQPSGDKTLTSLVSSAGPQMATEGFELDLFEKVGLRDGRHANNPWLQELPDPVTKITWDNYLSVAPKTAAELGLVEGDVVVLKGNGSSLEMPVQIQPGQSPKTLSAALGYGRKKCGKVGEGVGVSVYPLVGLKEGLFRYSAGGYSLEKTGRKIEFAATQIHHSMEGRPIIKEASLAEFQKNPAAGNEEHETLATLWKEREKNGHSWGMVIDLNKCTGCSACIVGCQSENNVAVVGKDEVRRRREMHWIRIDRYYSGSEESPETAHQPMMCQHCEHAPCETVCPVLATTHSSDGLNMQTYNRCVGTRYCANNCPYKVRRFNWFDYANNDKFDFNMNSEIGQMSLNPDIVVRTRGVMEKCSMCTQRIQEGKLQAKKEGRTLGDGEIKTACQQSCPADAIVFGDLNDAQSQVAKGNENKRFYHVLEELSIRPVVGYLTKIRNNEGEGG